MKKMKIIQIVFAVALVLSMTACGKTPAARFYTLSPMASKNVDSQSSIADKHIISINKIKVAAYLDRAEIVTRSNPTHVELADFDRWAEPFDEIVASALAENITSLLPSVFAIIDAWPEAKIEYQVLVKIKKFESDNEGNIHLDANWGILQHSTKKMGVVFESNIVTPGSSGDFEEITKNMSLALATLSEEIAVELIKLGMK